MPAYRLKQFAGQVPKTDPREIAINAAQDATNVFLTSGRIDPMYKPLQVAAAAASDVKTIYKLFNSTQAFWLSWKEQVDIAESPVYVANNARIAFSSPEFEPRQTDMTLAHGVFPYPSSNYVLGVTPPVSKPTLDTILGGSGTVENRSYVYTFVTQWGEESAPSPAMDIASGFVNATWNVLLSDVAPANSYTVLGATHISGKVTLTLDTVFGLRALETITISGVFLGMTDLNGSFRIESVDAVNKKAVLNLYTTQTYVSGGVATRNAPHNTVGMKKRVYRTVTTSTGTDYYQVGEDIDVSIVSFADNNMTVGSPLVTTGWAMPPANLQGLVTHASGAMIGFVGNQVYMSMPYSIYAWPTSQSNTLDYNVVGLGVFGQTVAVLTDGRPYAITFTDPAAASAQKLDKNWPCIAKRGITVFNDGVFYPTNLGLVYIGASGVSLISEAFFAQRDWMKLVPSSFIAAHYDDRYYAYYNDGINGKIMIFSKDEGISFLNIQPTAMVTDRKSGELFVAFDGYISQLNASEGLLMPYSWQSKEFVEPIPVNLGACKVDFIGAVSPAFEEAITKQNLVIVNQNAALMANPLGIFGAMNTAPLNEYKAGGSILIDTLSSGANGYYVSVSLYANGKLQFTKKVTDSNVWRFPAGLKYDNYSIGITGTAPVKAVVIGGTPMELRNV